MSRAPDSRFSDRVADYVRWRPGYPDEVVRLIGDELRLTPPWDVADLGSGTGLSALPFLRAGHRVVGVEPNERMRAAGDAALAEWPSFRSVAGRAEETGLEPGIVDLVVAAQAFHWFDPEATRLECARILRPHGRAALIWNTRRTDSTPFLRAYEALLLRHGTDYDRVRHDRLDEARLTRFLGSPRVRRTLYNEQDFDLRGLVGRALSSSYAPAAGQPGHDAMLDELREIFHRHERDGVVRFEYDTEIHIGRPG